MKTASSAHVCTCGRRVVTGDIKVSICPGNPQKLEVQVQRDPWNLTCEVPASFRYTAELVAIEAVIQSIRHRRTVRDGIVYQREPYTSNLTIDFERTAELAQLRIRQVATRMASEALEAQRKAFAQAQARNRLLRNVFGQRPEVPAC